MLKNKIYIKKANKKHNNFYTYTFLRYTLSRNKIIITCPIHSNFDQTANSHLNGNGCPKCKIDKHIKRLSLTTKTFLEMCKGEKLPGDTTLRNYKKRLTRN